MKHKICDVGGLSRHTIEAADRTEAVLKLAQQYGRVLCGLDLRELNLAGRDLCNMNCAAANLREATLTKFTGRNTQFSGANMLGVRADQADLFGSDFRSAVLRNGVFRGADLQRCDFGGACLIQTEFADADISEAVFVGADMRGAIFDRAKRDGLFVDGRYGIFGYHDMQSGFPVHAFVDMETGEMRVEAGCRRFTLGEARSYWGQKPQRRGILAAVEHAVAGFKIAGWREIA